MTSDAPRLAARRLVPLLLVAALAPGCNKYELFALAGYEQASFQNDADVLFIIDNSPSMEEEATALGLNFQTFIQQLADPNAGGSLTQTLSDAVDNYVSYTEVRGSVLDYQLAITTTTVDPSSGDSTGIDPGEAGTLIGDVIARGSTEVVDDFLQQLLCDTTNWNQTNLADEDPDFECGQEAVPAFMSEEYLDCICGEDMWTNNQGGGTEQPLEAALLGLCRAVPDPPEVCFHTFDGTPKDGETFETEDIMSSPTLVREGATSVVVVVTDEGDNSTQFLATGDEDASFYLDAYAQFDQAVRFAVIGPRFDQENFQASSCEYGGDGGRDYDSVPYWSVNRLYQVATQTGGFYADITSGGDDDCEVADFSVYLEQLGQLLVNLVNAFELKSIPDPTTIRVFVDGTEVAEAVRLESNGSESTWSDGWAYEPSMNAVVFWGTAVPDYNADVQIYYRPLEGKPRELPF
ncbi:hypothetical protein L6R53_27915 [Myxococcota bacterium]|nr:hypothetical protein [Myxococcota bacterium]